MRLIIALLLLLSFSSAFASKEEFIDRYKEVGLENGKIVADFYISPFNDNLHYFFRLKPDLIDDLARAKGIIHKDDSLWNYYTEHEKTVIKARAEKIKRNSDVIFWMLSLVATILGVITAFKLLTYHTAGEDEKNERYDSLKWLKTSLAAAFSTAVFFFPNFYNGHSTIADVALAHFRFVGFYLEQFSLSSLTSSYEKSQFILDDSKYKGSSENAIANYQATALVNNMLVYLESEKEFHRNTLTNKIYDFPEKYLHIEKDSVSFYMTPDVHKYKKQSQLLHKAGYYNLARVKLDEKTADKIYPIVIVPVQTESEIASGWKTYENQLKRKFSDKYEDSATYIRLASYYYHHNSYLNALANKLQALAPTQALKAAEYLESYACEDEKERRYEARKALENNLLNHNYCLVKNGSSVVLAAESGNLEKAVSITEEIADELKQLLITTNQSLYESVKFQGNQKLLIEATQKGISYFFRNEAQIKQAGIMNNQLARYLNNSVKANIVGNGFFIDDENLETRVNSGTPLSLDTAYQEYISHFSILPDTYADFEISKRFENYSSLKSSTDEQKDTSTIYNTIMSFRNNYEESYNVGSNKEFSEMEEPSLAAIKIGVSLIDFAFDVTTLRIGLSYIGTKDSAKASKASAKNHATTESISIKNVMSFSLKKILDLAQTIISPLSYIAVAAFAVGFWNAHIVPNVLPVTHFVAEQAIILNHTVLLLFPALIGLRFFNKNDADNWRYITVAITGYVFSLIFLKFFIDIAFIATSVMGSFFVKLFLFESYELFAINTESSSIASLVLNGVFFLIIGILIPWIIYTTILKICFSSVLAIIKKLHINDDFLNFAIKALQFIDLMITILCPLVWIFNRVRSPREPKAVRPEPKNNAKGESKQKTSETKEEPTTN